MMRSGLAILVMFMIAAAVGCDESTAPADEGFVLEVTVTDTLGQPLENMAVWRQSHLEGTIPDPPSMGGAAAIYLNPLQSDSLIKVFPNPFNGYCTILFSTSDFREVLLEVKDWRGNHVKTILNRVAPEGMHYSHWTQRNDLLETVMTGVYTMSLHLTDTLDTHLFTYSAELECTVYDDFFSNCYLRGWTLGKTDENGFLATRDLDFFPSLQGHEQQIGRDEEGDYNGVFGFSKRVTIRVSTVPGMDDEWIYYMSRDIDLVDGPNSMEFVFAREDSIAVSEIY